MQPAIRTTKTSRPVGTRGNRWCSENHIKACIHMRSECLSKKQMPQGKRRVSKTPPRFRCADHGCAIANIVTHPSPMPKPPLVPSRGSHQVPQGLFTQEAAESGINQSCNIQSVLATVHQEHTLHPSILHLSECLQCWLCFPHEIHGSQLLHVQAPTKICQRSD